MAKSNRRSFLAKAPALAVATVGASAAAVQAKDKAAAKAPARAPAPGEAGEEGPVEGRQGSGEAGLFSPPSPTGTCLFISGIGAHFEGDIKAHTDHVLKEIEKKLEENGSSMAKVLKVNVYLNDLKDYAAMNEVFLGRFGRSRGVRTTIAAAGGIPGNSLVEIDCIAYI
jgi:enamine deaminase RidA (YjgF/YER057c/UK114 family)